MGHVQREASRRVDLSVTALHFNRKPSPEAADQEPNSASTESQRDVEPPSPVARAACHQLSPGDPGQERR